MLASHCVFSGNLGGGMVSAVRQSAATNCVTFLQSSPYSNVMQLGDADVTNAAAAVFVNAPTGFARITAESGAALTLDRTAPFAAGDNVEIADDGTLLSVAQASGTSAVLNTDPAIARIPATIFGWGSASSSAEDLQLAASSVVAGAGMAEQGAAAVDPGPIGSPVGDAPGTREEMPAALLWCDLATPALATGPTTAQAVSLRFSATINAATVTSTRVRVVNGSGNALAAGVSVIGSVIQLSPPGGGWGTSLLRIELHRGIAATNGTVLSHPTVLPLQAH